MGSSRNNLNGHERVCRLLDLLPTAMQAITSASQVHQVAERACTAIGEGLGAQAAFVLWYSDSERAFVGMPSGYGIDDASLLQIHLPAGMCAASDYAFVHGKAYISDQTDEEELLTSALRRDLRLTRLLTLPVRDEKHPRGVLHVVNKASKPFDGADVAFASSIALACGAMLSLLHYRHYIDRMAVTDGLTGLFNRYHAESLLEEHAHLATQNKSPLSIAVVYLDHLKYINDTYGYRAGDRALLSVAQALQRSVSHRAILARYAGDEFVALLPGVGLREAQTQLQTVRDLIAQECWEPVGSLSVSIGVVSYPESAVPADQLLSAAEDAAMAAKRHGRNQVVLVTPRSAA
ncbi:MAG: sensor domain-containing diguanylate cyclase [Armatimonadota bacterium]|nr:sensor domain-containing diguanylate cyclase [bacterium]MDW8320813.1 sensor domain-containing diguanylate cyclase [Armatimonadota bacterium]